MACKKKQDNTSDNIQNIVNDASVSEKKTSQKRARSKVEDDSSNKKPEIAELEDRLGLSIDYNEEENAITLTPNRPLSNLVSNSVNSTSSLRRRPLDADAEFVAEGDEVPDYVFGADNENEIGLELINRCELYLIGRSFTPTIIKSMWEPTDEDESNVYGDIIDCSTIEAFNSDPWNLFIYPKAGRQAVTFSELTSGTFYLQCAAAEYVPNPENPSGEPIKKPMKDAYGRQMYRKVYFNGEIGQFPRINISLYNCIDPCTGETTVVQYEKYQYVTNEVKSRYPNYKYDYTTFIDDHIIWPQRKVTIYLLNINFTVEVLPLYMDDRINVQINYNRSSDGQIIEMILPELYSYPVHDETITISPSLYLPFKLKINQTPTDLKNVYRYAHDANASDWAADLRNWGGELHLRIEPEDCAPDDGFYSDVSLYACAYRNKEYYGNIPPYRFEYIYLYMSKGGSSAIDDIELFHIDRNVNLYITPVRKNYTKKFIIMTDGNVIVSDKTQLNDYLGLYTDEQIKEMNTPDRIVVGYQNTIGFLSTSSEWPWNLKINIRPSIAQDVDGVRLKLIGRYDDGENENYINYIAYKANPKIEYNWDDSSLWASSTIDNITGTVTHEYQFEHGDEHIDSSYIESYITYDVSIGREALDESWERLIFYIAFETIPKFNNISLKLFAGYNPNVMQIRTLSRTEPFDSNDFIKIGTGDDALWSMQYTTQRADMNAENHLVFKIDASELISLNYSHIYISDNAATSTDYDVINSSGETTLIFNGRLYNNMSIYVRPLPSVKIVFYPVDSKGASISVNGIFTLTYNGSTLGWGDESTWTSESGGNINFSVARVTGSTTIYTRVLGTTNYNHHTSLTDRIAVSESHAADLTIIGVGNPDPTVSPLCVVTVKFLQTFTIEAYIDRTQVLSNWPAGVILKIKDDEIRLSNGDVVKDTNPDTTTEGITHYTFGDVEVETLYSNTGTSKLEVINTFGASTTLLFRRLHIKAQNPLDGYINLCTDDYVPTTQNIDNIQIEYTKESLMHCDVEMFQATNYTLTYECAVNSKLKIIAYQPPRGSSWPISMPDTLPSGWTRVCRSGSPDDTWTPGTDHTANYASNQLMPILCFRIMQPLEDEDEHQEHLDFYNKLTFVVNAVNRTTGYSAYQETFYHQFKLYSPTDHAWRFDFYPSMSTTAIDAFKASNNGKYDFTINCKVETDYDINIYIKKISYQKNEMPATAGEQPGWADETLNQDSEEITALIPGNRYTGNDDANIQVFAYVPGGINPTLNGRKLRLQFCDTNSSSQLSKMYPLNTEIANPTQTGGANMWRFDIKTKRTDIWAGSADKTPTGHNYTSFSEYYLHLTYEDPAFEGALYTKTYKFHIQPVFKVWWSSNGYSFDNEGKAILYFFNHYTDLDSTHISGKYPNHPEEPPMNFPTIDQECTSSSWPSSCVVQPSGGTSDMRYIYRGTEVVGSDAAYKIEVTGGYEFNGTVTMKATVLNCTTSCLLRNIVTFSNITWWDGGTSPVSALSLNNAYISPIECEECMQLDADFIEGHGLNLSSPSISLTCTLPNNGGIITGRAEEANSPNKLFLYINTTDDVLSYNAERVDGGQSAVYYTGQPIPMKLSVPYTDTTLGTWSYTLYIKLGAVMGIFTDNPLGGELKPHNGQSHILRARGVEWYSPDGGTTISKAAGYCSTHQGHKYYAHFRYSSDDGATWTDISEVSASGAYASRRMGHGLDITAPSTWTDTTVTPPKTWSDDWGAWNVKVTNENELTGIVKISVTTEVTDDGATHSLYHWYDDYPTTTMYIRDFLTLTNIKWWDGQDDITATNISSVLLSPIPHGPAVLMTATFPSNHGLDLTSTSRSFGVNSTLAQSGTIVGVIENGSDANSINLKVIVNANLANKSDSVNTRVYYTGMEMPFTLSIPMTAGGTYTDSETIKLTLGPVIAIHHNIGYGRFWSLSANAYGETFGSELKPETGQKIVLQSRAHEWYSDDNGATIQDTGNDAVGCSSVSNRRRRGRLYDITWTYNDISDSFSENNISVSVPADELIAGESSYTYTRRYENSHIKIEHAATWASPTAASGQPYPSPGRYHNDSGAWRVAIINGSGLLDGVLKGVVNIQDLTGSSAPEIALHHWYDNVDARTTILNVRNFVELHITSVVFREDEPSATVQVWNESQPGPILIPGFGVLQDGPDRLNGDIKIYVSGTPLNTYPDAFTWIYFKPLGNSNPSDSNIVTPDSDFDERHNEFQFGYYAEYDNLEFFDLISEKDAEHPTEYLNESSTYQLVIQLRDPTSYNVLYTAATEYQFKFDHIEGFYGDGLSYDGWGTAGPTHSASIQFEHEYINNITGELLVMPATGNRRLTESNISGTYYEPATTSIFYSTTETGNNTLNLGVKHMSPTINGFYITARTKYNEFKMYILNGTAYATKYLHIICNPTNGNVAMFGSVYFTTKPNGGAQYVASLTGDSGIPTSEERINLQRYGMNYITSGAYQGWSYFTITVKQYLNPNGGWNYYFFDRNNLLQMYQPQMLNQSGYMEHYNVSKDYPMLPFSSLDERQDLNSALGTHKEEIGDMSFVVENYIYPVFTSNQYGDGPSSQSVVMYTSGNANDDTLQPSDYNHGNFWPIERDDHSDPSVTTGYRQYKGWLYYTQQALTSGTLKSWDNNWRFELPINYNTASSWFNTLSTNQSAVNIINSGSASTALGVIYCS